MALQRDPAKRWDKIPDDASPALRCYLTEYAAPRAIAPVTGLMADQVFARSWREAQAICDARRGDIEIVLGVLASEYEDCDACGALVETNYDGDASERFQHAPLCIRRFTIGELEIPEGYHA